MARTMSGDSASPCFRASNTTKSLPRPCIFRNAVMAAYIGGRPPKGQWPVDHCAGRFLKIRRRIFDATDWRDDMRAGRWIAAIPGCVFAPAAVPTTGAIMLDDP